MPITALGLAAGAIAEAATHKGKANIDGTMQVYLEQLRVTESGGQIVFDSTLRGEIATALPIPVFEVATVRFTASSTFKLELQSDGRPTSRWTATSPSAEYSRRPSRWPRRRREVATTLQIGSSLAIEEQRLPQRH